MREADDEVLRRGRLFVDARHTTIGHIGEVMIPMEAGVIGEEDILADYYDLSSGAFARRSDGRDHDLQEWRRCASGPDVTARYILGAVQSD
jgi:ornithine cyclodeaminase